MAIVDFPEFFGLEWRKSSFCEANACVEVATAIESVFVRDSKVAGGPVLQFSDAAWRTFAIALRAGEFDRVHRN
jgi:hypothetical protein